MSLSTPILGATIIQTGVQASAPQGVGMLGLLCCMAAGMAADLHCRDYGGSQVGEDFWVKGRPYAGRLRLRLQLRLGLRRTAACSLPPFA